MNDRSMHLEEWFTKNESAIQTAQNHPQLCQILQNNLKLRNMSHDNQDRIFSSAALNMKALNTLAVDSLETLVEVLSLVLDIIRLALKQLDKSYATLAKIPLWMMKTNIHLIRDSNEIVEKTINSFCGDFRWLRQQLSSSSDQTSVSKYLLIARIPLTLLAATQKMFPNNHGTPAILQTTIAIVVLGWDNASPEIAELDSKFSEIAVEQRLAATFYADFFKPFDELTDQQLRLVLEFCNGVVEDLSHNEELVSTAMHRSEGSNFCLLLIQFFAENPQSIHLYPELYDQLLLKIVDLILSENLSTQDFQFIETALVVRMCSEDYWQSLICYRIFREILIQLRSSSAIAKYGLFFRKLFAKFPGRSIFSIPKLLIMSLLKLILQDLQEPGTTKEKFVELDFVYIPGCDFQGRFNEGFRKLNDDPCVASYYEIVGSLKSLRTGDIDTITAKNFLELIKMTEGADFGLYTRLIGSILDVMRSATNDEVKMICMVKLSSVLKGVEEKPWEIELKLLFMLFSFIPLAKVKTGLPQILIREFSKLLCDSPNKFALIRVVQRTMTENLNDWSSGPPSPQHVEFMKFLNSFNKVTSKQSTVQTLLESKNLKRLHNCNEIKHVIEPVELSSEPQPSNLQLRSILEYSKSLEYQTLNESDLKIISEIVETLNNLPFRMSQ